MSNVYKNLKIHFGEGNLKSFDTQVAAIKTANPLLPTDLKKDLLKWGKELNWYPDFMRHRYENWVNGLQWDWLISNQRYFGKIY